MALSDFSIIKKIQEGDIKTFEQLFKSYYSPLCFYATSLTGQKEAAEEIVQELFYTLWKEKENIQLKFSLKNYLYKSIRNRSFQYLEQMSVRNRYRETVLTNDTEENVHHSPEEQLEYKELQQLITNTMQKLPIRRQRIFQMHRFEGMKYAEIAENLSLSVKTIEAEMSKTLLLLRKEIDNYFNTPQ